jgi:hypothetical protein
MRCMLLTLYAHTIYVIDNRWWACTGAESALTLALQQLVIAALVLLLQLLLLLAALPPLQLPLQQQQQLQQ